MSRSTWDWRLGGCPEPELIIAWVSGDAGHDWELGEHILRCAACSLDRERIERGEDIALPEPDGITELGDVEPLDLGMRGAVVERARRMSIRPPPGTLWILKRPPAASPLTPVFRVYLSSLQGEQACVALVVPVEERLPHDVVLDEHLAVATGVVEVVPLDALALCSGEVAADLISRVAHAPQVPADDEQAAARRAWEAERFEDHARALRAAFGRLDREACLEMVDQALRLGNDGALQPVVAQLEQIRASIDPYAVRRTAPAYLEDLPDEPNFLGNRNKAWSLPGARSK